MKEESYSLNDGGDLPKKCVNLKRVLIVLSYLTFLVLLAVVRVVVSDNGGG